MSKIGLNTIIADDAVIGDNCTIGHNVVIHPNVVMGANVRIDDNTIIGKFPMFSPRSIFKTQTDWKPTIIGDNTQIGANVVIYIQCEIGTSNLIADFASIRENVTIGNLNIIGRGTCIENFTKIGNRNKIETNVYLSAYTTISDYCFIAPCVCTSNDNYVGRDPERFKHFKGITMETGARIGANATILPGITLHRDCLIAAGSIVTKNVPEKQVWMGSPAKFFSNVSDNQLLDNNRDDNNNL
jgi:hypothetical protein